MKTGAVWERTGRAAAPVMAGGVLMVEVAKRTPARSGGSGVKQAVRKPLGALSPGVRAKPV